MSQVDMPGVAPAISAVEPNGISILAAPAPSAVEPQQGMVQEQEGVQEDEEKQEEREQEKEHKVKVPRGAGGGRP